MTCDSFTTGIKSPHGCDDASCYANERDPTTDSAFARWRTAINYLALLKRADQLPPAHYDDAANLASDLRWDSLDQILATESRSIIAMARVACVALDVVGRLDVENHYPRGWIARVLAELAPLAELGAEV